MLQKPRDSDPAVGKDAPSSSRLSRVRRVLFILLAAGWNLVRWRRRSTPSWGEIADKLLLERQSGLVGDKQGVAILIAGQKRLEKQLDEERSSLDEWGRRATLAARAGDDALARECLLRKKEHELAARKREDEVFRQKEIVDKVRDRLRALNDEVSRFRDRLRSWERSIDAMNLLLEGHIDSLGEGRTGRAP